MKVIMETLAPLLIGFMFGWLLQKAGLSRYERIVNVFRFHDLAVLKFLLSALVTAAVGIASSKASVSPWISRYLQHISRVISWAASSSAWAWLFQVFVLVPLPPEQVKDGSTT